MVAAPFRGLNVTLISLFEGNTRKGHAPKALGVNEPSVAALQAASG
jgi:hypothetical protein